MKFTLLVIALFSCVAADRIPTSDVDPEALRAAQERLNSKPKTTQPSAIRVNGMVPLYPDFDATKSPAKVVEYVKMAEAKRATMIKGYQSSIEMARKDAAKSREIAAQIRKQIDEYEAKIKSLKLNMPAFEPQLDFPLTVGQLGYWGERDHVLVVDRIIDGNSMLIKGSKRGTPVLLRGVSTKGIVDDQNIPIPYLLEVTGTQDVGFTTFVLERTNFNEWLYPKPKE